MLIYTLIVVLFEPSIALYIVTFSLPKTQVVHYFQALLLPNYGSRFFRCNKKDHFQPVNQRILQPNKAPKSLTTWLFNSFPFLKLTSSKQSSLSHFNLFY